MTPGLSKFHAAAWVLCFALSAAVAHGQVDQTQSAPAKQLKSLLERTRGNATPTDNADPRLANLVTGGLQNQQRTSRRKPPTNAEPSPASIDTDRIAPKVDPDVDDDVTLSDEDDDQADTDLDDDLEDQNDDSDDDEDSETRKRMSFDIKKISTDVRQIGIQFQDFHQTSPDDRSQEILSTMPVAYRQAPELKVFAWAAPDIRYQPLYFEDVALERYGQTPGPYRQQIVSGLHFFKSAALLPLQMLQDHPCECDYPLGFCRPGSNAPFTWQRQLDAIR